MLPRVPEVDVGDLSPIAEEFLDEMRQVSVGGSNSVSADRYIQATVSSHNRSSVHEEPVPLRLLNLCNGLGLSVPQRFPRVSYADARSGNIVHRDLGYAGSN